MPTTITPATADTFKVYTTFYITVSGPAYGSDILQLGVYRVAVEKSAFDTDTAGAAYDLLMSSLFLLNPNTLSITITDHNGVSIPFYGQNGCCGVHGQIVRVSTLTPAHAPVSYDETLNQMFSSM